MRMAALAVVVLLAHTGADAQEPVRFLQDRNCGSTTVLIGLLEDVAVYARCETVGSDRVMHVSVQNHSTKSLKLKLFSIGFCDQPVLKVGSPDGWQGQIANDVEWSIRPNDFEHAIPTGARRDGFSLVLKHGWVRSGRMSVELINNDNEVEGLASQIVTHDCML